jgi:UDP-glucose 6-dehydrogenase
MPTPLRLALRLDSYRRLKHEAQHRRIGYVGLVTGACLAEVANDVLRIDTGADKVKRLPAGAVLIFEPWLDGIVQRNVEAVDDRQKLLLGERIVASFGEDMRSLLFAVWGLAFKPNSDDVRKAPSLLLIRDLLQHDETGRVHDPAATSSVKRALGKIDRLHHVPRAIGALANADVQAIVTEWKEFRSQDFERMRELMRQPLLFDGRNLYDRAFAQQSRLRYQEIGRSMAPSPVPETSRSLTWRPPACIADA